MALEGLKRKTKRNGYRWKLTPNDEAALLEGCHYDKAAADHVCDFFTRFLKHSKGEWAGKSFDLLDWQRQLLSRLFGWKRSDGTRRYRQAGVWVPK